jgi:ATP-dependent Clp protease ATP-binding subunit ClpC
MAKGKRPLALRTKQALELAMEGAQRTGHDYVGTEHILLGLLEGEGLAGEVLRNLRVTAADVRLEIPHVSNRGPAPHNRFDVGPEN